jgi:hypothetical protein
MPKAAGILVRLTTGTLTVNNSQVTDSSSPGTGNNDGVGGGLVNLQGTATLNSSQVTGNFGGGAAGGGIARGDYTGGPGSTSSLKLNNSDVNDNTAPLAGGGGRGERHAQHGLPSPNMSVPGGVLTINHSQVTGNSATLGEGGIHNVAGGVVSLASTAVSGNNPDNCEPTGTIAGCTA